MRWEDGFLLNTKEVLTSEHYWRYIFTKFNLSEDLFRCLAILANQETGWLICTACSMWFRFDRTKAKEYAKNLLINPPDSAPVKASVVARIAVPIWKEIYKKFFPVMH